GRIAHQGFNFVHQVRVFHQVDFGIFTTLAEQRFAIAEVGTALVQHAIFHTQVNHIACLGDAFVVHDVEFAFGEGRGDLVLFHLDSCAVAHDVGAGLNGLDAANVQTYGSIELQSVTAAGGLWVAEHHANLGA